MKSTQQTTSLASFSQGLNFSWRPSSTLYPPGPLTYFFLSSLHTHCTTAYLFSCRAHRCAHAHPPYTVNKRHAINVLFLYIHIYIDIYIYIYISIYIWNESILCWFVSYQCRYINNFLYSLVTRGIEKMTQVVKSSGLVKPYIAVYKTKNSLISIFLHVALKYLLSDD